MPRAPTALALALASLAGCAPAPSADAGPVIHGCAEAIAAARTASCNPSCGIACDFTESCCVAPSDDVVCRDGELVRELLRSDTGPCPDGGTATAVAHDCAELRALGGDACVVGACGIPCDFAGICCVAGAFQAFCAGGRIGLTGGDVGVCVRDTGVGFDAGPVAHDCDQLRALCPTASCSVACDFTGLCCLHGEQAGCSAGALTFVGVDVGVCAFDAGASDASTSD